MTLSSILLIFLSMSSRGEGDAAALPRRPGSVSSIHALRVEGDRAGSLYYAARRLGFYPRPPGGGRPARLYRGILISRVSIHALRVEGDMHHNCQNQVAYWFLSTPSGWRATVKRGSAFAHVGVSIHALRVEGDAQVFAVTIFPDRFLSTPSGWRATSGTMSANTKTRVSIHALRVEGDPRSGAERRGRRVSIHALRVEGDNKANSNGEAKRSFYPRPPGGGRLSQTDCP